MSFYLQGGDSLNTLESTPSQVDGLLTTCDGDLISLTCSHDNARSTNTLWNIGPPANCTLLISHDLTTFDNLTCDSFSFQDITMVMADNPRPIFNSTAVAVASVAMSGSVVECRAGNLVASTSVGNVSLCIIGESCSECIPHS